MRRNCRQSARRSIRKCRRLLEVAAAPAYPHHGTALRHYNLDEVVIVEAVYGVA